MIRPYKIEDKAQLIGLLRLNTPQYFDPSEERDFVTYLDRFAGHYFVVEENGLLIGCGGFNYADDRASVRISWDIVHPDFQGKGIGKALTLYRIEAIRNHAVARLVIVRTTQLAFGFYEKLGFVLEKTEPDFWAKGFDLYQMNLTLHPTAPENATTGSSR